YTRKESLITFRILVRDTTIGNFIFVLPLHVNGISFCNPFHLCCEILSVNERTTSVLLTLEIAYITHYIGRVVLVDWRVVVRTNDNHGVRRVPDEDKCGS